MNKDKNYNNDIIDDAVQFQLDRIFSSLGRNILVLLEDLKSIHNNNFEKLRANLPPELQLVIDMADYFDQNTYSHYRGKILDQVMGAKRDIKSVINSK